MLGRDVAFFVVGYGIAIGTAFLPPEVGWLKWVAAAFLFVLYAVYVRLHFTDAAEEGDAEELNRLHITRRAAAATGRTMLEIDALPGRALGDRAASRAMAHRRRPGRRSRWR